MQVQSSGLNIIKYVVTLRLLIFLEIVFKILEDLNPTLIMNSVNGTEKLGNQK